MGMTELSTKLLMAQSRSYDLKSYCLLTIGRQGITFSVKELRQWAKEFNFGLLESHLQNALAENRTLTDTEYFLSLGFKSVASMDVSGYEEASIICNLNEDIPPELQGKFDVVYDGGSTEHMFNVPKAFENYNKLLRVGGLIMHALPSTGNLDHGFYMFSPTLLYDYYSQNEWAIKTNYMIQLPYDNMNSWKIYEYSEPGPFLEHIEFKGRWGMFFVAQKQAKSTHDNDISQNYFRKLWESKIANSVADVIKPTDQEGVGILRRVYRSLPPQIKAIARTLIYRRARMVKPTVPFKEIDIRNR